VSVVEAEEMVLFHSYEGSYTPPPWKTVVGLGLAVALPVIFWSLIGFLIWTFA
jgi:hypothetical protein